MSHLSVFNQPTDGVTQVLLVSILLAINSQKVKLVLSSIVLSCMNQVSSIQYYPNTIMGCFNP